MGSEPQIYSWLHCGGKETLYFQFHQLQRGRTNGGCIFRSRQQDEFSFLCIGKSDSFVLPLKVYKSFEGFNGINPPLHFVCEDVLHGYIWSTLGLTLSVITTFDGL